MQLSIVTLSLVHLSQTVCCRLDHRRVEDAAAEVNENRRAGLGEQYFLPPLLEGTQEEARAGGDRTEQASGVQETQATLHERRVQVVLGPGVYPFDVGLSQPAGQAERRIHQDDPVVELVDLKEGQPTGRVLTEQEFRHCV